MYCYRQLLVFVMPVATIPALNLENVYWRPSFIITACFLTTIAVYQLFLTIQNGKLKARRCQHLLSLLQRSYTVCSGKPSACPEFFDWESAARHNLQLHYPSRHWDSRADPLLPLQNKKYACLLARAVLASVGSSQMVPKSMVKG